MDFWKTLVVLVRRWYVAVPTLVMSLGLAAVTFASIPAKYEANGSVVLLSPSGGASTSTDDGQTNPLLGFDSSLSTVSTALTQVLLSPAVVSELSDAGATADFQVGNGNLSGPFINVVADGRSPGEAQRTVRLVLDRARIELQRREKAYHAPPSTYIQVDNLVKPTDAKQLVGGKVRAAGAALALGLAASLSMAFLVESIGENRRDRRRRAQQALSRDARDALHDPRHEPRRDGHNGYDPHGYDLPTGYAGHNGYESGYPAARDGRDRGDGHRNGLGAPNGTGAAPPQAEELTAIISRRAHGRTQG